MARSRTERPCKSAIPYSVTTQWTSPRKVTTRVGANLPCEIHLQGAVDGDHLVLATDGERVVDDEEPVQLLRAKLCSPSCWP
jgi:hypothetical protein